MKSSVARPGPPLLDRSGVVEVEHLRAAIAVWDYCEASAAYIFGGKVGDPFGNLRGAEAGGEAHPDSDCSKWYRSPYMRSR